MPEALFGPVFIVLPSLTSSSIDHVAVLPPVLVCWSWSLPVAVEERSEEDFKLKLQINMDHVIMQLLFTLPKIT